MSDGKRVAVRDADVLAGIDRWGVEHFRPLFQGRSYQAWKQDAALAIIENADLRACMTTEAGRISLVRALQRSASTGLSLNPQLGESALVAINGAVSFWPMKNGIVRKAMETGAIEYVEAGTVFVNDTFRIRKSARGDDYEFEPALEDRGAVRGYFAVAVLKSGRSVLEFWTHAQAEEHKKKFGKGLSKPGSAWNTNAGAMHEKSVLKALLSGLHLPPSVAMLYETEESGDGNPDAEPPVRNVSGGDPDDPAAGLADLAGEEPSGEDAEDRDGETPLS